jgi:1-acyl-sn-glycerol-3-phosphate acyltransferase
VSSGDVPPRISTRRLAVFAWYARRLVARRFTAVRVMKDAAPSPLTRPSVFYANHAAWWDPLVMLLVARWAYPGVAFYAPIDAAALARYPTLARLGFFGVEPASPAGARRFLAVGRSILAQPNTAIALTPQGRFTDVRERPVELKGGLARLLKHAPSAEAIAVAIEYPFWNEARPEVLVRFGREGVSANGRSPDVLTRALSAQLERELDALAACACRREARDFVTLLEGFQGIGFVQDLPSRLRARRKGSRFEPRHAAIHGATTAARGKRQ